MSGEVTSPPKPTILRLSGELDDVERVLSQSLGEVIENRQRGVEITLFNTIYLLSSVEKDPLRPAYNCWASVTLLEVFRYDRG